MGQFAEASAPIGQLFQRAILVIGRTALSAVQRRFLAAKCQAEEAGPPAHAVDAWQVDQGRRDRQELQRLAVLASKPAFVSAMLDKSGGGRKIGTKSIGASRASASRATTTALCGSMPPAPAPFA